MTLTRDQLLRLAALRRAEAELYEEAAGAGEGDPRRPPAAPPRRRRRPALPSPPPLSDLDLARARRTAAKMGLRLNNDETDPRNRNR